MTVRTPDLGKLFNPRSVALIGASDNTAKLSGMMFQMLGLHGFDGAVYPVNPGAATVQGVLAYASIAALPEVPDLVVIAIPAAAVPDALEACALAGIGAAVIITSGFAEEAGEEGAALQDRIARIARHHGMAVLGPNAQGYANLPRSLCVTFSPSLRFATGPLFPAWRDADQGGIAVIAQSGALGFALFDSGRARDLPYRYVVTTGNEAGVSAMEVADYLLDEGKTEVIAMFLEGIRDPEAFRRVAERALREGRPLIVAKTGMTAASERSAASHTGALAGSFRAHKAMFDTYGVTLAESIEEITDLCAAFLLNRHRLPGGRRMGIVTASGGAGGWMADACALAGLEVPELEPEARARIDIYLPSYGTSANPVDVTAQAVSQVGSARLMQLVADSQRVDGIIGITTALNIGLFEREGAAFGEIGHGLEKPVCLWSYTRPSAETFAYFARSGYALSTNLRHTARAMAAMAAFAEAQARFAPPLTARPAEGDAPDRMLSEHDAKAWLATAGVCAAPGALVRSAAEAEAALRALGRPAAFKIQSPQIPHKTDAGGVALNVTGGVARAEYDAMLARVHAAAPGARIDGVLVEPMAPADGFEMILGISRDPLFGPMLLVGAGGIFAEVLDDAALSPLLSDRGAALHLLRGLKCAPVLAGARGQPPRDTEALVDLMLALCRFAAENGDRVDEIDLNPVLVHPAGSGVSVLDALIVGRLAEPAPLKEGNSHEHA
ncbi:MAG: acetate--CoA ligase family protein [Pseudodonghicola sp.]